jgi:hypothetical protein
MLTNVYLSTVTISIQIFISSFYKFKRSSTVLLLSKGCEILHNCFLQCVLVLKSFSWLTVFKWAEEVENVMALDQDYVADVAELQAKQHTYTVSYVLFKRPGFSHVKFGDPSVVTLITSFHGTLWL